MLKILGSDVKKPTFELNNAESVGKGTQFCCDLISRFGAGFGCMEVNGSVFVFLIYQHWVDRIESLG